MDPRHVTLISLATVLVGAVLPGVALDLVAIVALALLVLPIAVDPATDQITSVLSAPDAAAGFGSTTLLAVACMFVLAEALLQTGAVQVLDRVARKAGEGGVRRLMLVVLPVVMILSGLMNNTGVIVLLLPVFLATSRSLGIPASRLLIPLSYAAILGGTLTLVGTTTNLLVDGLVQQEGLPAFRFFDFLPMGLAFSAIGFVYLVLVAPRLLPDRVGLSTLVPDKSRFHYTSEVELGSQCRLVGRSLSEFPELTEDVRFLELIRDEETIWPSFADTELEAGDLLVVKGPPEALVGLIRQPGLTGPPDPETGGRVLDVTLGVAEVLVGPGSRLDGATVRQARLRERFGVVVLGVLRHGDHMREHLGSVPLRVGDTLLVQGEEQSLQHLAGARDDLILLGGPLPRPPGRKRRLLAISVGAAALALAATGVVALPIAVLLGSVLLVAAGCLSSGQAYRAINLRVLVVLGCMLGVGLAVYQTGLAGEIADALVSIGGRFGPQGVLAALYLTTMLLTEIVTNAGTASIMVPIAIAMSRSLHGPDGEPVSYLPFVMAVALAASVSLLTPIGYQTNLLVYGPGGYKFHDYVRVGLPLALLLWVVAVLLLPVVFPF